MWEELIIDITHRRQQGRSFLLLSDGWLSGPLYARGCTEVGLDCFDGGFYPQNSQNVASKRTINPLFALISYDDYCGQHQASRGLSRVWQLKAIQQLDHIPSYPSKAIHGLPYDHGKNVAQVYAHESSEQYLTKVKRVLDEIKSGRYYQLNLLRYFNVQLSDLDVKQVVFSLFSGSAPMGFWFYDGQGIEMISFSPERFICIDCDALGPARLRAYPIKGTDTNEQRLKSSVKDQAELAMIVDLMRHDLYAIAQQSSIKVTKFPCLMSIAYVYHLYAEISAYVRSSVTVQEILAALCPAGSITGAPKMEVMKAIAELEQRARGYFMGNALFYDQEAARLDSNVMIRSFCSYSENLFEFAAGSGIVIKSSPEAERDEVWHKAQGSLRLLGLHETHYC